MPDFTQKLRLSTKLPASIIALSTATAGVTAYIAYNHSASSLTKQAEANLNAILVAQETSLENWLHSIEDDIEFMRTDPTVRRAIEEFSVGWMQLGESPTAYLQNAYIRNNPNPVGQKDNLNNADDGSLYSEIHEKYHPYFRGVQKRGDYYDVFLFDAEGDLIYSVYKEADYATNLVSDQWANTDLGAAFRSAKSKAVSGDLTYYGFKPYAPSADAPASFISAPIRADDGSFLGVLAFQMPIGRINELMAERTGLGETGISYLVGSDGYLRNDIPETDQPDILETNVDLTAENTRSSGLIGVLGEPVIRKTLEFEFLGTKYTFVTEQNKAELLAPTASLRNNLLIQLLISALGVGVLGFLLSRMFTRPIDAIDTAMAAMASGDLGKQIPETNRGDEIGSIAVTLEKFREQLHSNKSLEEDQHKVVEALGEALEKLADGDLTFRINTQFASAYEQLRLDFNKTLETLDQSFTSVTSTTLQINDSAQEISQAADDLSRRTENQAATLEETAAAIEQMTSSVSSTASGAHRANDLVVSARTNAESSGAVVDQAIDAMSNIEKSADQISQIVGVIDEIAFQTNLLALNAGVEAARAGDAGRGFAVVASEVRALAQRSSNAAKEIKDLITVSEQHVSNGVQQVNEAGDALRQILESVREISEAVSGISSAAQEQSMGLAEINSAVSQLDQVTQQNAAMVEESTAASHALRQDAGELGQSLRRFRTSSASPLARNAGSTPPPAAETVSAQQERVKAFATHGSAAVQVAPQEQPSDDDWLEF